MNQPLGNAVGNALEVQEAVELLQGGHEGDLKRVSLALAEKMLVLGEVVADERQAREKLEEAISSGKALEHFACMISAQGGNPDVTRNTDLLPKAKKVVPVQAEASGYISRMDTAGLGISALLLGAGRSTKEDVIDPAVGYWMRKRLGDYVEAGETLAEFHLGEKDPQEAIDRFRASIELGAEQPEIPELIYSVY
jgi:pyrimidine-nucleoside phosphorylase